MRENDRGKEKMVERQREMRRAHSRQGFFANIEKVQISEVLFKSEKASK